MKIKASIILLGFPLSAVLIWTAAAQPSVKPIAAPLVNSSEKLAARVALMDKKKAEIISRVGVSAPLELPPAGEEDFVAEAIERGFIVETTLAKVEAALIAAKATPGLEDDFAAMRLAHRGAYRFFLDDKMPAANSEPVR